MVLQEMKIDNRLILLNRWIQAIGGSDKTIESNCDNTAVSDTATNAFDFDCSEAITGSAVSTATGIGNVVMNVDNKGDK